MFRLVREYIRHVDKHKDASPTKLAYIKTTCDDLSELVAVELARRFQQPRNKVKKRSREIAGIDSTSESRRPNLGQCEDTRTEFDPPLVYEAFNNTNTTEFDQGPEPLSARLDPMCTALSGPSSLDVRQMLYADCAVQLPQPIDSLAGDGFDAPLLHVMSSIPTWTAGAGWLEDFGTGSFDRGLNEAQQL